MKSLSATVVDQGKITSQLNKFNMEKVAFIKGKPASGKTTLAKQILNDSIAEKNIVIVEPSYAPLSSLIDNTIKNVNTIDYTEMNIDSILSYSPDLVVFEEALYMPNITFLHTLFKKGIKVIIIKQDISDSEMFFIAQQYKEFGDHIVITANKWSPIGFNKVEVVHVENNGITKKILYQS